MVHASDTFTHRIDRIREREEDIHIPEECRQSFNRISSARSRNLDYHDNNSKCLTDVSERNGQRVDQKRERQACHCCDKEQFRRILTLHTKDIEISEKQVEAGKVKDAQ